MVNFGRGYEEDRIYSPYNVAGFSGRALLVGLPVAPAEISEYPRTLLVPETWHADALAIDSLEAPLDLAKLPPPTSGMAAAIRATLLLAEEVPQWGAIEELLQTGDLYSQAYILARIFRMKETAGVVKTYLKSATTAQQIHSLALGLAAACNSWVFEVNDYPASVKVIYQFAGARPEESNEIRKFIQWYRDGRREPVSMLDRRERAKVTRPKPALFRRTEEYRRTAE